MRSDYRPPRAPFRLTLSATNILIASLVVAFFAQNYHSPTHPAINLDYFALSPQGLGHGYIWQLLTFQFLHAGIAHLAFSTDMRFGCLAAPWKSVWENCAFSFCISSAAWRAVCCNASWDCCSPLCSAGTPSAHPREYLASSRRSRCWNRTPPFSSSFCCRCARSICFIFPSACRSC